MSDLFDNKKISPMLLSESEPFDDDGYIFELKLDGIRCLAYLDEETQLINKRFKDVTYLYPELKNIHENVSGRVILDGELVSLVNGKPDFYSLQARSLKASPFKIEMESKLAPISFIAYDILYADGDITQLELIKRKKILQERVTESERLGLSRHIESGGKALFAAAKAQKLEGIVAKLKTSKYIIGKRSKEWLKIKVMNEDDLVVLGYVEDNGAPKDIILGYYNDEGKLKVRSCVYMGVSKHDIKLVSDCVKNNPAYPMSDIDNSRWCSPKLVGTVKYMERTPKGGMRQPVFKGIREDKSPADCVYPD